VHSARIRTSSVADSFAKKLKLADEPRATAADAIAALNLSVAKKRRDDNDNTSTSTTRSSWTPMPTPTVARTGTSTTSSCRWVAQGQRQVLASGLYGALMANSTPARSGSADMCNKGDRFDNSARHHVQLHDNKVSTA
jgi:hypothetical protein